jgi:hypothetical protein
MGPQKVISRKNPDMKTTKHYLKAVVSKNILK